MSDAGSLPSQPSQSGTQGRQPSNTAQRSSWKIVLAGAGYILGGLSILTGVGSGHAPSLVGGLEIVVIVLLAQNVKGIRSRIPLLNSSSRATGAVGWAILVILFTMVLAYVPSSPDRVSSASSKSGGVETSNPGPSATQAAAGAPIGPTATPGPANAPKMSPTSLPSSTPLPTATPKPSPTPVVGKRDAPVPYGNAYTIKDGRTTFQLQVTAVERNAWPFVKKANMFNEEPPAGNDYIVVKLRLKYLDGPQDEPYRTTDGGYKLYADNRFWGAPGFGNVAAEPSFTSQDIFPGATVDGWLAGRYLPVGLMDQASLVYDDVYFALK